MKIEAHADKISEGLDDFAKDADSIRTEVARLQVSLAAVGKRLPRSNQKAVRNVRAAIETSVPIVAPEQARAILDRLRALILTIQLQQEEDSWL